MNTGFFIENSRVLLAFIKCEFQVKSLLISTSVRQFFFQHFFLPGRNSCLTLVLMAV